MHICFSGLSRLRAGGQDERFSYVVLRRGGRKATGAPHAISRQRQDAGELHSPQPYMDAQPRSWRKSEARFQRALALEALMQGQSSLSLACKCEALLHAALQLLTISLSYWNPVRRRCCVLQAISGALKLMRSCVTRHGCPAVQFVQDTMERSRALMIYLTSLACRDGPA